MIKKQIIESSAILDTKTGRLVNEFVRGKPLLTNKRTTRRCRGWDVPDTLKPVRVRVTYEILGEL